MRNVDLAELTDRVRAAIRRHKPDAVVLEETAAGPIGRHLDAGLSAEFAWDWTREISVPRNRSTRADGGQHQPRAVTTQIRLRETETDAVWSDLINLETLATVGTLLESVALDAGGLRLFASPGE